MRSKFHLRFRRATRKECNMSQSTGHGRFKRSNTHHTVRRAVDLMDITARRPKIFSPIQQTFLVILFIVNNSSNLQADGFDRYRIKCNASELVSVHAAVSNASELARRAGAALPPKESTGSARFKRWFGGKEGDEDPVIKEVYKELQILLIFQNFWCLPPNSNTPERWLHTNAFVLRGTVGEIFVTSNFFLLPTTGAGSRAGTIVHEGSHQSDTRRIVDDDIDGDGHNDYGPVNAQKRAFASPERARSNADNFKYFAEDVVYGVP